MSDPEVPQGEPKREERWAVATKGLLPAVSAARQLVGITEEVFRTQTFHGLPREFFLWTALDEIFKSGVFLMRLDDLLGGEELGRTSPDKADPVGRAIEAILLEEVRLRQRRLCELHVQLVLLGQKNAPEIYRHFLLLQEAVGGALFNKDLFEFHGAQSEWVERTVETTIGDIHAVESSVSAADASWYATNYPRPLRASSLDPRLLTTTRKRIKDAFPLMTDLERLALGTTYHEAFAAPSESIHYRAGADPVDHSRESSVVAEGTKLSIVAMCALRRVHELLGRPAEPRLEQLSRALETNTEAPKFFAALNRPDIAVGDIVTARGYLGQVIDERVSTFGNRSLRVELLAQRPLPELGAVWFRAREVLGFLSKERTIAGVREKLGDPRATLDDQALRDCALEAWRLREEALAQRRPRP